jgi:hypothetical protein
VKGDTYTCGVCGSRWTDDGKHPDLGLGTRCVAKRCPGTGDPFGAQMTALPRKHARTTAPERDSA